MRADRSSVGTSELEQEPTMFGMTINTRKAKRRDALTAGIGMLVTGAALGGGVALLVAPRMRARRLRQQARRGAPVASDVSARVREELGSEASRVLSGDLPGSVGGLGAVA